MTLPVEQFIPTLLGSDGIDLIKTPFFLKLKLLEIYSFQKLRRRVLDWPLGMSVRLSTVDASYIIWLPCYNIWHKFVFIIS